jgi:hypothetical protein
MQVWKFLKMFWLKIICPQYPEMMLDEFCPLFFDENRPHFGDFIMRFPILLHDLHHTFCLNSRLCRIINATW